MIPIVNNNFVYDSNIGNRITVIESRINQYSIWFEDTYDTLSELREDYYYIRKVVDHQSKQIRDLNEILSHTVYQLKKLTIKRKQIGTHLSKVTKTQLKFKKEVNEKFAEYDKSLTFVIQKFNSLSLD